MAEPLRILQIYPGDDFFTGAAVQLLELASGLRARGHGVTLLTRPSPIWEAKCREAGITHCALPLRRGLDLASIVGLRRIMKRHRIQVVHCHKGRARTFAILASPLGPVPVIVLNRGVSFPLNLLNRLGYITRRVSAIVAVADSIKRGLVAQGVPEGKIEVIYSGTDTDRFHPNVDGSAIRRELALAPDQFLITQVGIRSWRGNADVLDAMARVARRAPQVRLLFVGARRAEALYDTARAAGLDGVVRVWGYREDIPNILAASDITVDAAYAGAGITGSLRESLAVETPVIGTDLEGIPELIQDGETGLLVPPRNPEALAQAILRIMENPVKAKEMARAGRKRVEALFSTPVKVQLTERLYFRLLAKQS